VTDFQLIASSSELADVLSSLRGEAVLAMDTEAASFHRYHDRIYLIQVSTRSRTIIIDPLAVGDLSAVGSLLSDGGTEIVFHDADYDLRLFAHQFGFRAARIFDTRVAAELLNEPGLSLAALLERYLGVQVDKRFQRADWSARPLSADMIAYAASDTSHLIELRDIMARKLEEAGRMDWAVEEFQAMTEVRWADDDDREPGWLRIKGARALPPRKLAALRELYAWREELASKMDRAEFRILGNEALMSLAMNPPLTLEALLAVKGVGRDTAERRGKAILSALERAGKLAERDLPRLERPPRRPREPEVEARLARLKEARAAITTRLGLEPGVICPNSALESVARRVPANLDELAQVPGMRRWQVKTFGAELLAAIKSP
jgi:ribonuclease D